MIHTARVEYCGIGRGKDWMYRQLTVCGRTIQIARDQDATCGVRFWWVKCPILISESRTALFRKYGVYRTAFRYTIPDFRVPA